MTRGAEVINIDIKRYFVVARRPFRGRRGGVTCNGAPALANTDF